MINIRFDPLQIFKASKSPAGLYARKKWLDESETSAWQDDFQETVDFLMKEQSADGSWFQSPLETIRHLFGLHLTVRERTGDIDKAMRWLIRETLNHNLLEAPGSHLPSDAFRELPFIKAQDQLTLICATLFLACVFQLENDQTVVAHYQLLSRWLYDHAGDANVWTDKSNILRAMIVYPRYVNDPATLKLVDDLAEKQEPSGTWSPPIPFFLTINALAHLNLESAHCQWLKASSLLSDSQNKDGSWGNQDAQWNTFLVVHALKNKKCL
ncbi:MAG TPA: hypothetical protein PLV50_07110 [Smithella sp.]|nr:hypothetical protein [Smithella sp.]MDM7987388.1 hypothetical protein [Smithella sp.]HNY50567.1 hypothetical protein [Smithella sp.]HOG90289.1 hypothetical protein [Smithella sp.]HOU51943.1 hypothetical protein [Smithella sp.]